MKITAYDKYNDICNKVRNSTEKELDSEPVYNKTFLKTKIKSYGYKATYFYDREMLNSESNHNCLVTISNNLNNNLFSSLKKYTQMLFIEKK